MVVDVVVAAAGAADCDQLPQAVVVEVAEVVEVVVGSADQLPHSCQTDVASGPHSVSVTVIVKVSVSVSVT